jgi:hypothetical protein
MREVAVTNETKGPLVQAEDSAVELLRKARHSFEHMGNVGFRCVAIADWLEAQVPVVSERCRQVLRSTMDRIAGAPKPRE